jgi:hypothetical protein
MFADVRKALFKLTKLAPRNGNVTDMASLWLEYRYGWRTLWYDILSINKAIIDMNIGRERFTERSGVTFSDSITSTETVIDSDSTLVKTISTDWSISHRGTVTADYLQPTFNFNPMLTGYETFKLSFILGWFVDIGGWIEALSFLTLNTKHAASAGYELTGTKTVHELRTYNGNIYTGHWEAESVTDFASVVRYPTSVSQIPHVSLNIDGAKGFDVLALLQTAFNGGSYNGRI